MRLDSKRYSGFYFGVKLKLALFAVLLQCGIAYGEDGHAIAVEYMGKGEYANAAVELEQHLKHQPSDVNAHYYLGECYEKLGKRKDAMAQYKEVFHVQPGTKLAKMAHDAFSRVSTAKPVVKKQPSKATRFAPPTAALDAAPPKEDSNLARQSAERAQMLEKERESQTKTVKERYSRDRSRINSDLQSDIANVPKYWNGLRRRSARNYDYETQVTNLRNEAADKLERINEQERREVDAINQRIDSNLETLSDAKSGVYSQLSSPSSKVKLKPTGTNLYIRNYESSKSK